MTVRSTRSLAVLVGAAVLAGAALTLPSSLAAQSAAAAGDVTYSNDPKKYQVVSAEIRSPQWKIAGPFRQGQVLPVRVGDVETKTIRSGATVEFSGAEDTVRVRLVGRKVSVLTYLCVPD